MAKKTENVPQTEGLSKEVMVEKYKHYISQRQQAVEFLTKVNAIVEFLEFELTELTKEAEKEKTVSESKDEIKPKEKEGK